MKFLFLLFISCTLSAMVADCYEMHTAAKDNMSKNEPKEERDPHTQFFHTPGGSYHFRYDTGNAQHQSFRGEKRYPQGIVTGYYGYVDPDGILRITEYIADHYGYRQRTILRYPVEETASD